jgi:tetraacyldisaccharide 4'-kinase
MGPKDAGDEPYLMATKLDGVPVLVGRDRYKMGTLAVREFGPEILVLDDGFQHLQLHRDLDLLLLDAARPFGNGHLLPRGVLREPLRQLSRGDAFILTRSDGSTMSGMDSSLLHVMTKGKPVFKCRHIPGDLSGLGSPSAHPPSLQSDKAEKSLLKGRRVLGFSGIARNEDFRATMQKQKCEVVEFLSFPDHYSYSDGDLGLILQTANECRVDYIVTTEKDYVRVAHRISWPINLLALEIRISFSDQAESFGNYLLSTLRK